MSSSKTILITGVSTGIGREVAVELAKLGHFVIGTVRNQEDAADIQRENSNIKPLLLDLLDEPAVRKSLGQVQQLLGGRNLDVLVNNAGFFEFAPVEVMSIETHRKIMDTNYFGTLLLIQTYLPMLRESKGRIINIASVNGEFSFPFTAAYSASKFAMEALSDALRRELDYVGVKVVVIEPSFTITEGRDKLEEQMNETEKQCLTTYPHFKQFKDTILTGFAGLGDSAEKVSSYVITAINSSSPSARYTVGIAGTLTAKFAEHMPTFFTDLMVKTTVFHGYVDVKTPADAAAEKK